MKTSYTCDKCRRNYRIVLDKVNHSQLAERSKNGLVSHTGFHICSEGVLTVSNLYIDADLNVRSYTDLSLPSTGMRKKVSIPGIPTPKTTNDDNFNVVNITKLPVETQFRVIIVDYSFNTSIVIGRINPEEEEMISIITSDLGTISLFYYPSEITLSQTIEKWLSILVNSLETLLPSKLGMIIEVMVYMLTNRTSHPQEFEQRIIKTILSSHEVFFKIIKEVSDELTDYLYKKYGKDDADLMVKLIDHIHDNPGTPLIEYNKIDTSDFLHTISLFLFLELEGIIEINRPGIIQILE